MMTSLFDRMGGEAVVKDAVDLFYMKVLADKELMPFFEGIQMKRQLAKQRAFLTLAFGGPDHYAGKRLGPAHRSLLEQGLDDHHVDLVIDLLGETLVDLGIEEALIAEAAAIVESVRDEVLGRVPAPV
ncbi:MAG: group 1 truncated hemoglobin [Planctomycetes bacterium]|nr:group 1 truncated hemoglobin [Planctomycetota bacterium]